MVLVSKVLKVLKVPWVYKVLREDKDFKGQLDLRVRKGPKVHKVVKGHKVHKEDRDQLVPKVPKEV